MDRSNRMITRAEMLRAWLAYYKARGRARSLAICQEHIDRLRLRMVRKRDVEASRSMRVTWGMAYGVQKYCLWLMEKPPGRTCIPLAGGLNLTGGWWVKRSEAERVPLVYEAIE